MPSGGSSISRDISAQCARQISMTEALGLSGEEIRLGLEKAVERGTLLRAEHEADVFYFLNSPRGRLAAEAFAKGDWRESAKIMSAPVRKSNIFKLYEENIGALTPLLSDMLREAEKNYPAVWFEEAFEIAVSSNIRNWKYVEAILARWKEKGKDERKDQQNVVKDADDTQTASSQNSSTEIEVW